MIDLKISLFYCSVFFVTAFPMQRNIDDVFDEFCKERECLIQKCYLMLNWMVTSEISAVSSVEISIGYSPGWRQLWAYNTSKIIG